VREPYRYDAFSEIPSFAKDRYRYDIVQFGATNRLNREARVAQLGRRRACAFSLLSADR
jgi:hypothetical protein